MDVIYRFQEAEFEWDEDKARSNIDKHGIGFEEAVEALFDPFYQSGDASTGTEQREFVLGYSLSQRLLLVVHTQRGKRTRVISARRATRHERRFYENI